MFGFGKRKQKAEEPESQEAAPIADQSADQGIEQSITPQPPAEPPEAADTTAAGTDERPRGLSRWFSRSKKAEETPEPAPSPAEAETPAAVEPEPAPEPIPQPEPEPPPEPEPEPAPAPEAEPEPEPDGEPKPAKFGLFSQLRHGLARTRRNLGEGLASLVLGKKHIDDDLLEEIETLLLTADVGIDAVGQIIERLTKRVRRKELTDPEALTDSLKAELREILEACDRPAIEVPPGKPLVVLMVGINGAGKTTTIGKLAKRFQGDGHSVMLAAGDTFRAAAVEQLQTWGERNQVPVIAQHSGADSASVCFDGLQAATARGIDVLFADTAGRLHTKTNLMDELSKIARVMKKIDPDAPHEVLLVVDATSGQNAVAQALEFNQAIPLTGLVLTKLDGTAKGGVVFALAQRVGVPIRFIGVGEKIDDLRPFDAEEFVSALFDR
ncbi:MAG: signal recognition particle-docking protein FtsY [Gammaproteobacteria bacterium]|nr:signal recognition particle-docking protein FtsY [Gammaproteobacteria bacterium]